MSQTIPKIPADFAANEELAWTLPREYYLSDKVFEHEVENIFTKQWLCMAHISELANPNDYITRQIFNENIIIVRGKDNILRAFYNVCPHRGHQLLEGSGEVTNVITCPYHAWTFKLDGSLALARNCEHVKGFEEHDKDHAKLTPIQVEEHAGFIYINLDPNCSTTVEDQLPGMAKQLLEAIGDKVYDLSIAKRAVTHTKANWKLIVDNYIECYHCGPAHPDFADSIQVDQYWHNTFDHWAWDYGFARSSEKSFKVADDVEDPNFQGFWIWPCTMFNIPPGADFMTVIYEFPINARTTLQHYDIMFLNKELTQEQKDLIEWYVTVFRPEDLNLVESVQRGIQSRGYVRGQGRVMTDTQRSGISEHGIAHFHNTAAQYYQDL